MFYIKQLNWLRVSHIPQTYHAMSSCSAYQSPVTICCQTINCLIKGLFPSSVTKDKRDFRNKIKLNFCGKANKSCQISMTIVLLTSHMPPFWCPRVLYKNHDHRTKSLLDFAIANQAFRLHSLVFDPFLDTQALLSLYRSTT